VIHTRFLVEGGELRTLHGRIMIGMVVVEDLIVVALTIALPTIGHARPFAAAAGCVFFKC
jgi:CPA2 family monovalent cation:H+ antiporter-2